MYQLSIQDDDFELSVLLPSPPPVPGPVQLPHPVPPPTRLVAELF